MNLKLGRTISLLALVGFCLTDCKHPEVVPPPEITGDCTYQAYESSNGSQQRYEYNSAGYLIRMTMQPQPGPDGPQVYVYKFVYNGNNQISGASITLNGKTPLELTPNIGIGDAVTFNWVNNRLVKVIDLLKGKAMLTTTIGYDAQGRIISLIGDAEPAWGDSFEKRFTYQANGDYQYTYLNKTTGLWDYLQEVKVNNAIRHPQSLLAPHGLPYDVFYSHTWHQYAPREIKGYDVDEEGRRILVESTQASQQVTNQHQVLLSQQLSEEGRTRTVNFSLGGCN